LLGIGAVFSILAGCTFEGAVSEYLVDVFPEGSVIQVTNSCSSAFGAGGGAAVFEVTFPQNDAVPELAALKPERGVWTREDSLQIFAAKYGSKVGIAATVLDGKNCLNTMRDDADSLLSAAQPGLFYRSHDQTVVIMMPDGVPGTGMIFSQGR
jgi:hypothetical protein